jgi:hypothetical protein
VPPSTARSIQRRSTRGSRPDRSLRPNHRFDQPEYDHQRSAIPVPSPGGRHAGCTDATWAERGAKPAEPASHVETTIDVASPGDTSHVLAEKLGGPATMGAVMPSVKWAPSSPARTRRYEAAHREGQDDKTRAAGPGFGSWVAHTAMVGGTARPSPQCSESATSANSRPAQCRCAAIAADSRSCDRTLHSLRGDYEVVNLPWPCGWRSRGYGIPASLRPARRGQLPQP